eukprot:m.179517 g.179517  ORF g.179517 m.179517 type:complete len:497 (-) comp14778_c0_seq1:22-1512(-)
MSNTRVCVAAVGAAVLLVGLPTQVQGGSNGLAVKPPMSWRSWNQFGWYITQDVILSAAQGLVNSSRPIKGMPPGTSLLDLGYKSVGMDEGWAACPAQPGPFPHGRDPRVDPRAAMKRMNVPEPFPIGHNMTAEYHKLNSDGTTISPVVDTLVFPDMKAMVDKIHAMGLKAGWYLDDCLSYCLSISDDCPPDMCIPGDVKAFTEFGFDNLKIDGCSAQRDVAQWATLINKSGVYSEIENCHNGPNPNASIEDGGCPYYHQYRSSGDINNGYPSWVSNAQTVAEYATSGRTGPTCWAYPDMLMIGVQGQTPDELHRGVGPWTDFTQPSVTEQRTHFGMWCILSSPLTLSLDFRNDSAVDSVWDIITNTAAIDVNQAWAGSPGTVFATSPSTVNLGPRVPLRGAARALEGTVAQELVEVPAWQAWYKPLPGGAAAILVANHGNTSATVTVKFSSVPGLGSQHYHVTDVWKQEALAGTQTEMTWTDLASHDSAFITVHPE